MSQDNAAGQAARMDVELAPIAQAASQEAGWARQEVPRARPVLKWVGGKAKLVPELMKRVPETYGRYFEPFAGGAALFFALEPARAVLSDANADLMGMYWIVRADVGALMSTLGWHTERHSEDHYNAVREWWNDRTRTNQVMRAAALMYLNRAGFNGLWRVNAKGENNVGFGKEPTVQFYPDNLRAASVALAQADLRTGDFRAAVADAGSGDLVYFDPPYDDTFAAYTPGKCSEVDQAEIAFAARTLAARGVTVIVSNADTPRIRALYAGWTIDEVSRAGTVSCKGSKRGRVKELIITSPGRSP